MSKLTVIIPTVDGRDDHLRRAIDSIKATTPIAIDLVVVWNKPSCGLAWNEGLRYRASEYVLLFADDLEATEGWFEAAQSCREMGGIPAPSIYNADGSLDSMGSQGQGWHLHGQIPDGDPCYATVVPFFKGEDWEWIGPFPDLHYYSDDWFSMKARSAGFSPIVTSNMRFNHYVAQPGRLGNDRSDLDRALFISLGGDFGELIA